ncbi:MAG TPA: hypothetical protein VFG37_10595 [Planctomycetota bacterium]|nr:hypothetical protein [Planctomycetota bacterium]
MDLQSDTAKSRSLSGRWIVLAIVGLGAGMGFAGFLLREARGPGLPMKPGAIVVVTCETVARRIVSLEGEPVDPNQTSFPAAVAPSSELVASLGSLWTGKMPRESGLVREGDALRADLPTLAEIATGQGFVAAAFVVRDAGEWKESGLSRGFASVDARPAASDADLAAKAAEWLLARGTAPTLAWLHLRSDEVIWHFVESLRERGALDHAALVVVRPLSSSDADGPHTLPRGGHVQLSLRLPVALLPLRVDPQPVSLVDVVASLCEVFGIRAPDGIGTPWLLHPQSAEPHFVLSTRPLAGEFADADEVWLYSAKVTYVNAPAREIGGGVDVVTEGEPYFHDTHEGSRLFDSDSAMTADLRKVVEDRFAYRFDSVELAELLESEAARSPAAAPVHDAGSIPARIPVARSTRSRLSK